MRHKYVYLRPISENTWTYLPIEVNTLYEARITSSTYDSDFNPARTMFISLWEVAGLAASFNGTWKYPFIQSKVVKYVQPENAVNILSMLGVRKASWTERALHNIGCWKVIFDSNAINYDLKKITKRQFIFLSFNKEAWSSPCQSMVI